MATSKPKKKELTRLFCNQCHGETLHDKLKEVQNHITYDSRFDDDPTWEETINQLFECRGCRSITLRYEYRYSEYDDGEVRFFPPRVSRIKPRWFRMIPPDLQKLMSEIYSSLDANNLALPMMGARAVLDLVIVDIIGDAGSFAAKLEKLHKEQHITAAERTILEGCPGGWKRCHASWVRPGHGAGSECHGHSRTSCTKNLRARESGRNGKEWDSTTPKEGFAEIIPI